MAAHRGVDREALETALRAEGASGDLARAVRFGIGYHHAGLSSDERTLLEQAFRYEFLRFCVFFTTISIAWFNNIKELGVGEGCGRRSLGRLIIMSSSGRLSPEMMNTLGNSSFFTLALHRTSVLTRTPRVVPVIWVD